MVTCWTRPIRRRGSTTWVHRVDTDGRSVSDLTRELVGLTGWLDQPTRLAHRKSRTPSVMSSRTTHRRPIDPPIDPPIDHPPIDHPPIDHPPIDGM